MAAMLIPAILLHFSNLVTGSTRLTQNRCSNNWEIVWKLKQDGMASPPHTKRFARFYEKGENQCLPCCAIVARSNFYRPDCVHE